MQKEIEIKIKPDGSVSIEMLNFQGSGCAETAEKFIKALGETISHSKKPEYFQEETKNKNCNKHQ